MTKEKEIQREESGKEKVLSIPLVEVEDMSWEEFENELVSFNFCFLKTIFYLKVVRSHGDGK